MKKTLSLMLILTFFAVEGVGNAQNSNQNSAQLQDRIQKLERQLRAVQRRVFKGEVASGQQAAGSGGGALSSSDRGLIADLSVRVDSIDRQLRILTGRLEELEYAQRQTNEKLALVEKQVSLMPLGSSPAIHSSNRPENGGQASVSSPNGDAKLAGNSISARDTGSSGNAGNTRDAGPVGDTLQEPKAVTPSDEVVLPNGTSAEQYQYAFAIIRGNDLDRGQKAMEAFLQAHPSDTLSPNAVYWLGRIHLRQTRYGQAAKYFLRMIDEYPSHSKRADSMVDLAETLIGLDSAPDACDALAEYKKIASTSSPRLQQRADDLRSKAGCR